MESRYQVGILYYCQIFLFIIEIMCITQGMCYIGILRNIAPDGVVDFIIVMQYLCCNAQGNVGFRAWGFPWYYDATAKC